LDGIVKVKNFFEENNTLYIIMEYVEGYTLNQYINIYGKDNKLLIRETLTLFLPFMDVLEKVHKANIFHRDISPDNLIISKENYSLKLIDFGSAKQSSENEILSNVTVSYKEGYTPPEQYLRKEQGAFSDVFSVAASIYKVITGKKIPFTATSLNINWEGNKPSDLGIDIEPNVEFAIMKALEPESEKRFKSISDFKNALINNIFYLNYMAQMETKSILTENKNIDLGGNQVDNDRNSKDFYNNYNESENIKSVNTVTKSPIEDKRFLNKISLKKKIILGISSFILFLLIIICTVFLVKWIGAKNDLNDIDTLVQDKDYNKAYSEYRDFINENKFSGLDNGAKDQMDKLDQNADELFISKTSSELPEKYSESFDGLKKFCESFIVDYKYSTENKEKAENLLVLIESIEKNNEVIQEYEDNKDYYEENKNILDTMDYNMNEMVDVAENGDTIINLLKNPDSLTEAEAYEVVECYNEINTYVSNNEDSIYDMLDDIENDKEDIIKSGYFTKDEYDDYVTFINEGLGLGVYSASAVSYLLEEDYDNTDLFYGYAVNSQTAYDDVEEDVVEFMSEKRDVIENTEDKVSKKIDENDTSYSDIKEIIKS
jgi:serine/threonine protein kinase